MTTFCIDPLKPHIGGIVRVERADLMNDDLVIACRLALEERGALIFPRMNLSDAEQLALTDKLGVRGTFTKSIPGAGAAEDPDVYKITLDKKINPQPEYVIGTLFWHVDGVTLDQPLPKATLLTARKIAPEGGQTQFANLYAAYDHLPDREKKALEGIKVLHTIESSMRPVFQRPDPDQIAHWGSMGNLMVHPLVWTHESGRRSLLIGTHADSVLDMPFPEGRALLARLTEWASQPDFTYSHEWQEGDLVVWDNCGVMHRVIPYDADSGRTMHRTTIAGEEKVGGSYSLTARGERRP